MKDHTTGEPVLIAIQIQNVGIQQPRAATLDKSNSTQIFITLTAPGRMQVLGGGERGVRPLVEARIRFWPNLRG